MTGAKRTFVGIVVSSESKTLGSISAPGSCGCFHKGRLLDAVLSVAAFPRFLQSSMWSWRNAAPAGGVL